MKWTSVNIDPSSAPTTMDSGLLVKKKTMVDMEKNWIEVGKDKKIRGKGGSRDRKKKS